MSDLDDLEELELTPARSLTSGVKRKRAGTVTAKRAAAAMRERRINSPKWLNQLRAHKSNAVQKSRPKV
jgi:hypothetical protein